MGMVEEGDDREFDQVYCEEVEKRSMSLVREGEGGWVCEPPLHPPRCSLVSGA